MDLPADRSTRASPRLQPTSGRGGPVARAGGGRPGRHRPCRTVCRPPASVGWWPRWCWSGCRWLVFAGELRGPAVAVTVVDDAVVRWLAGLDAPGLSATMRALAHLGSWWALITLLLWGCCWRCWSCDGCGICSSW